MFDILHIINAIIGTLFFVLLVIWILMIRATNRDVKKIEESIKAARRKVAEAEEKKDV